MQKTIYDVPAPIDLKPKDVLVYMHDSGMVANHDYACPCCRDKPAVLDLSCGLMQPCWECQKLGYKLIKEKPRKKFLGIF